jgi:hypothetical protein
MPGIIELMEGAMQQAPQPGRHCIDKRHQSKQSAILPASKHYREKSATTNNAQNQNSPDHATDSLCHNDH